jgi:cysteine desulfurase/selenocysteine lyase
MNLFPDEAQRRELFPVCRDKIFLGHGGVTVLPAPSPTRSAITPRRSSGESSGIRHVLRDVKARARAARTFIGAQPDEIALLGPTSLGLSLFANGIPWNAGDEVLCYHGDYPANVYPWIELRRRGVIVRYLEPGAPGEITPELVAAALTPRTRLVALASATFHHRLPHRRRCHRARCSTRAASFFRSMPSRRSARFQRPSRAHVDFLSADAHKWMLGPLAIGIVYVKKKHFELLRPTLLGAWNVVSPNFQRSSMKSPSSRPRSATSPAC